MEWSSKKASARTETPAEQVLLTEAVCEGAVSELSAGRARFDSIHARTATIRAITAKHPSRTIFSTGASGLAFCFSASVGIWRAGRLTLGNSLPQCRQTTASDLIRI